MSGDLVCARGSWELALLHDGLNSGAVVAAAPSVVVVLLALLVLSLIGLAILWWNHRRFLTSVLTKLDALQPTAGGAASGTNTGDLEKKLSAGMGALVDQVGRGQEELGLVFAHLQTLLAQVRDPVIITDEKMHVTLCNEKAQEVFPGGAKTRTGDPYTDFLAQVPVLELISGARRENRPVRDRVKLMMSGRVRTVDLGVAPVMLDRKRQGMLLVIQDQTEIIQNVQMKTDFVANASHELRTPLASIRAAVETIQESGLEDEALVKRCLNIIGGHVLRLQLLVQDLLDLSRTEDPRALVRFEPISLDDLRESLMTLFGHIAAARKLDLRFEAAPGVHFVRGDERLVMLIVKNLVDNSLKFTAAGHITVRWKRGAAATLARSPAGNPAVEVVLEVQDTGCGIAPEDRQRVFERFYTVNRSRGGSDRGTGLGLAIVKHAVAAMGGTVWLESEPGKGTTIRCSWPEPRGSAPSDAVSDDLADAPDA